MRWLELLNVEYGDCAVLVGKGPAALMVDCGSMNEKLRRPEMEIGAVWDFIQARYGSMAFRHFLLTHYHKDHFSGFQHIIKNRPDYFSRVYLPFLPMDGEGGSPLLEFALFAHVFAPPQSDRFQVNTACLKMPVALGRKTGQERIFTLKEGDRFSFDGVSYVLLNPPERDFPYNAAFIKGLRLLQNALAEAGGEWAEAFTRAKAGFIRCYQRFLAVFSLSESPSPARRVHTLEMLEAAFLQVEALRPQAAACSAAPVIQAALAGQTLREAYSGAVNDASLVFHNWRAGASSSRDLLMTGDVGGERLGALAPLLYPEYQIIKAPHHGTRSGFHPLLSARMPAHLLISSGDYRGGGDIAEGYFSMEGMKHCTSRAKCGYYKAQKECCARLNRCRDLPGKALSLKCPAVRSLGGGKSCGIYVLSPRPDPMEPAPGGSLPCLCDLR